MQTELAIIGAGPAGLAAAETAIANTIDITLIDEQARPGGQICRQPPKEFSVKNWLPGSVYKNIKELLNRVSSIETIHWLSKTTVLGITRSSCEKFYELVLNNNEGTFKLQATCVLIAPGCYDMPVTFPGCDLPGVMATGGIQASIKSQQIIPGERFLLAGTHPLQLIVADQIIQAGGKVEAVIFAQSFFSLLKLLRSPIVIMRHAGNFIFIVATIIRLLLKKVPIRFSQTVVSANGDNHLESIDIGIIDQQQNINRNNTQTILCDRLGLCFSYLANSELARQAGANYQWSAKGGGWIIVHNEWMQTQLPNLFVAGEITGVAGANASIQEGKLAALGIAITLNKLGINQATQQTKKIRAKLAAFNQFADVLTTFAYPDKHFLLQLMTDDACLCRCEEVNVSTFKQCLQQNTSISNANAAKLLSRAGMGMCQGRYCSYQVTHLISENMNVKEQDVGPFTARFPSKPVAIKSLLAQNLEN